MLSHLNNKCKNPTIGYSNVQCIRIVPPNASFQAHGFAFEKKARAQGKMRCLVGFGVGVQSAVFCLSISEHRLPEASSAPIFASSLHHVIIILLLLIININITIIIIITSFIFTPDTCICQFYRNV